MIIEAVYCRDKKEFEYLEEIRETKSNNWFTE